MTIGVNHGLPFFMSLIVTVCVVGMFGMLIDRLLISRMYGRALDSVVITWGLSMILQQGCLVLLGPTMKAFPSPLGTLNLFGTNISEYRLAMFAVAILLLFFLWILFRKTSFGMEARATMENAEIAESQGINTAKIYASTFGLGSAIAGLCGAMYAPLMSLTPTMGQSFIMQSFVTVIAGGSEPLIGTALSATILGSLESVLDSAISSFAGIIGLLLAAIVIIRLLPGGFSSLVEKWRISHIVREEK